MYFVVERRFLPRIAWVAGFALVLIGVGLLSYHLGYLRNERLHRDNRELQDHVEALQERNRLLEDGNATQDRNASDLSRRIALLEKTATLDKQALAKAQDNLRDMQDTVYRLKGELEFYEEIMNAGDRIGGLGIQGLYVQKLADSNQYRYKVVLTHLSDRNKTAKGRMKMTVMGEESGEGRSFELSELSVGAMPDVNFKFENFKIMEGYLSIPPDFVPLQAVIHLYSVDGKKQLAEKVLDWPKFEIEG